MTRRETTAAGLSDPDRAYRMLIDAHRGLSDEESAALNARLLLILIDHVADDAMLGEAIALARRSMSLDRQKAG